MGRPNRNAPSASPAFRQEATSLEEIYAFRGTKEVADFLEEHPFLIPLLSDAYPEIEKHFGPHPQVFLEVVTDPEAADDQELYAFVATRLPVVEGLKTLEHFDQEWWLSASDRAQFKLTIDIEFV